MRGGHNRTTSARVKSLLRSCQHYDRKYTQAVKEHAVRQDVAYLLRAQDRFARATQLLYYELALEAKRNCPKHLREIAIARAERARQANEGGGGAIGVFGKR